MTLTADEKDHRGLALKLHRENWNTWIAKVEECVYILS
jgi:hypothetical protein